MSSPARASTAATAVDAKDFRKALGRFATGVTIVTTRGPGGVPVGVTANSFNSVSLEPPMVLWSLARSSKSMEAFALADRFAVHVLSASQKELSNRFASRGADKFAGIEVPADQLPLLEGCAALFVCKTVYRYEGGDHVIFVGEVVDFTVGEGAPLLFHAGRYAEARQPADESVDGIDANQGRVGPTSLLNLLAQAQAQVLRLMRGFLGDAGLAQPAFLILTLVAQLEKPTRAEIGERIRAAGYQSPELELDLLCTRGWVATDAGELRLTPDGRAGYLEVLTHLKALEDSIAEEFSDLELADARDFLRRIIRATADEAPALLA